MKKLMFLALAVTGMASIALAQRTTYNNYVGAWENGLSWQVGPGLRCGGHGGAVDAAKTPKAQKRR